MSKETLHTLRLIIPGLILLIIIIPLLQNGQGFLDIKLSTDSLIYIFVVFGFGVVFYVINPRMYIMRNSLKKINENIKDKLTAPFADDPDIKNSIPKLHEGYTLMNVFYYFIDHDETLKARAGEVYFNGLIWSSLADCLILSPLGTIIYLIAFLITKNSFLLTLASVCVIIGILSKVLIPVVVKRHISFSNNQLTYIIEAKEELRKQIIARL
jgi:hypothetical protein